MVVQFWMLETVMLRSQPSTHRDTLCSGERRLGRALWMGVNRATELSYIKVSLGGTPKQSAIGR